MKWFELGLVVLTFATGLVWLADKLFLARRRAARDGLLAEEPALVDYSRAFFPVLALVLVLRSFVAEPYKIPSSSMMPNLLVGDFILVNKFSYGLRLPVNNHKFLALGEPARGDVVVFKPPHAPDQNWIKRVIGLPGDRIQIRHGVLHINGAPVKLEPLGEVDVEAANAPPLHGKRYRETLPGGRSYTILDKFEASAGDNTGEYVVPPGYCFVMGDNRDDSTDSRFAPQGSGGAFIADKDGVGFVPFDNLVGRADTIFFSADGSAGFLEVWNWPAAIRWDRLFGSIR